MLASIHSATSVRFDHTTHHTSNTTAAAAASASANNPTSNNAISNNNNNRMNSAAMNRSRSARNVMARTLPILERGGSTRNFRELPPDRRRSAMLMMESPGSTRNMRSLPENRVRQRSNSTRRFFVADQASRSSQSAGGTTISNASSSSLSNQFRRINLERTDSASSMGSMQSWGSMRSLGCGTDDNGADDSGHNTNHDSTLSILSMESLSIATPTSQITNNGVRQYSFHSNPYYLGSGNSGHNNNNNTNGSVTTETDDMMSLYSRDSVKVRQNQMEQSVSSLSLSAHAIQAVAAVCRTSMEPDDDMFSFASASECTVYSFDRHRPLKSVHTSPTSAQSQQQWS
ncbi:expressed unknown protein [Seminavis robusta]|uniref:Uncharacterized protein n=1 Tax=Seminavis robusta TaxID=568900 RepID=A0A9N8HDF4_9STRA|nr:expressed unknown protein [Seminavis robusta]|eukprot:Sro357_g125740.1 n/a (344) ;mRNA; r:60476-61507